MLPQLTVNSLRNIETLRNIPNSGRMQDAGESYKMHQHLGLENRKSVSKLSQVINPIGS